MKAMMLLSVALVASTPAAAQTSAPAPSTAQAVPATAKNPLDKVVCRTEEVIGSRLGGKRICMTVREWQEEQASHRAAAEELQQRGQGTIPSG